GLVALGDGRRLAGVRGAALAGAAVRVLAALARRQRHAGAARAEQAGAAIGVDRALRDRRPATAAATAATEDRRETERRGGVPVELPHTRFSRIELCCADQAPMLPTVPAAAKAVFRVLGRGFAFLRNSPALPGAKRRGPRRARRAGAPGDFTRWASLERRARAEAERRVDRVLGHVLVLRGDLGVGARDLHRQARRAVDVARGRRRD